MILAINTSSAALERAGRRLERLGAADRAKVTLAHGALGCHYRRLDGIDAVLLVERGLARKRSLALDEFAVGHEALTRFVAGEPLRRWHECVLALLALESEPVDLRL